MELLYYQYFLTVAECRSVSKAAEKLYTNQPYLSKVMSRLEKEFGVRLFDRKTLPIRLTPEGECFAHYARDILEMDSRLHRELSNSLEAAESFIIGTFPDIESNIMPQVIPELKRRHPFIRFNVVSYPWKELSRQLESNAIHAVFAVQNPDWGNAVMLPIYQDRVLLVIHPSHPFFRTEYAGQVNKPWFAPEKLNGDSFILPSPGSFNRQRLDLILSSWGAYPKIYMETNSFDSLFRLISNGFGIGFIPESVLRFMPEMEKNAYVFVNHALALDTLSLAYYQAPYFLDDLVEILQAQYRETNLRGDRGRFSVSF